MDSNKGYNKNQIDRVLMDQRHCLSAWDVQSLYRSRMQIRPLSRPDKSQTENSNRQKKE